MKGVAVYAGSFDPVTVGHVDVIQRAAKMFDHVVIAIGVNSSKKPLFTVEEREELLEASTRELKNVSVELFDGLLVSFCAKINADVIIRGLRASGDFEYELGIALANRTQNPGIDTIFLATSPEFSFVSSSIVKELARHQGNVSKFVTPRVAEALRLKFCPVQEEPDIAI